MTDWYRITRDVEALEDLPLDRDLVAELQAQRQRRITADTDAIHFYTPTFKTYGSTELPSCGKAAWPAVSITGGRCKLQCDHCKARVLEPMIAATTPEALWRRVGTLVEQGARGMLLTGGSNHRDEVEYGPFYPVLRRLKDEFPTFRVALHTALVDHDTARCMEQAGVDVAMMDVIGAQETVTQVYHLKRPVRDFESTLEALVATRMRVVPHIVLGLHYGRLLGEWRALEMVRAHRPDALVLVVVMPQYASPKRPFAVPDSAAVGRFFMDARSALPGLPLLLGCARPPGVAKVQIDTYAVLAGLNGMAHPSEGTVELAARLGRRIFVTPVCCSMAVGEELMATAGDAHPVEIDAGNIIGQAANGGRPGSTEISLSSLTGGRSETCCR